MLTIIIFLFFPRNRLCFLCMKDQPVFRGKYAKYFQILSSMLSINMIIPVVNVYGVERPITFYNTTLPIPIASYTSTIFILSIGTSYLLTILVLQFKNSLFYHLDVFNIAVCIANSVDPAQMPHFVASDLCLLFAKAYLPQYFGLLQCPDRQA